MGRVWSAGGLHLGGDIGLSDLEGQGPGQSTDSGCDLGDGLLDVESRDSDVEDQDFGTAQFGCSCFRPR